MPSNFSSTGSTTKNNTGEIFIDQVPLMLNLLSAGNGYISNLLQLTDTISGEPKFFQEPFVYSIIDNVNKNIYTSSSSINGNLITTIYNIPYTGLLEERIATFITFYDYEKQVLNYKIPRELSYNSIYEAIVNVNLNSNIYYLWIPSSFIIDTTIDNYIIMEFKLNEIYLSLNNIKAVVSQKNSYLANSWELCTDSDCDNITNMCSTCANKDRACCVDPNKTQQYYCCF
jgi:hypothetical protein